MVFNDDNYDTFTSSTYSLLRKYPLSDLDDFSLGDVMRANGDTVLAIGKKGDKEASSRICMNVTRLDEQ